MCAVRGTGHTVLTQPGLFRHHMPCTAPHMRMQARHVGGGVTTSAPSGQPSDSSACRSGSRPAPRATSHQTHGCLLMLLLEPTVQNAVAAPQLPRRAGQCACAVRCPLSVHCCCCCCCCCCCDLCSLASPQLRPAAGAPRALHRAPPSRGSALGCVRAAPRAGACTAWCVGVGVGRLAGGA
jgi:hypothetical protein